MSRGGLWGQLWGIKGILTLSCRVSVCTFVLSPPNLAKRLFHLGPHLVQHSNKNMCDAISTKQAFLDETQRMLASTLRLLTTLDHGPPCRLPAATAQSVPTESRTQTSGLRGPCVFVKQQG